MKTRGNELTGEKLPTALEGAFVAALAQTALLLSKPLISLFSGQPATAAHFLIIAVSVVTFFNIAANWVNSKETSKQKVNYTRSHLFWDIAILGVFFSISQILLGLCGTTFAPDMKAVALVAGGGYVLISCLFIVWNLVEYRNWLANPDDNRAESKRITNGANARNAVSASISLLLILVPIYTTRSLTVAILCLLWSLNWVYVIYWWSRENGILTVPIHAGKPS